MPVLKTVADQTLQILQSQRRMESDIKELRGRALQQEARIDRLEDRATLHEARVDRLEQRVAHLEGDGK